MSKIDIHAKVYNKLGTQIYQTESLFDRYGFAGKMNRMDNEESTIMVQGISNFKFPYMLRVEFITGYDLVPDRTNPQFERMMFRTLTVRVGVNAHAFDYPELKEFEDAYRTFKDNVPEFKETFKLNKKEGDNIYNFIESKMLETVKNADEATKIYVQKMLDDGQMEKVSAWLPEDVKEMFVF